MAKGQKFVNVVFNSQPRLVRNDRMAGRDYIVVPMVMLTEGVHEGSEGPYLYTNEEIGKRVMLWNKKPVVVGHPDEPSACTPEILNVRQIGDIMNAKWDKKGKRIIAEAWLDEAMLRKVDKGKVIQDAIANEDVLELSTGLFADSDEEPGDWNGEKFQGTLKNFGPDHLAVLPDAVGACSVEDGAGFIRNEQGEKVVIPPSWATYMNGLSANSIRDQLQAALKVNGKFRRVEDISPDDGYFVYSEESPAVLYKQEYLKSDDKVSLSGTPSKVSRVVSYVENAIVQNIVRRDDDGKWYCYSEDGKKRLSKGYGSKAEAMKRLGEIEYFKTHKNEKTNINKELQPMDKKALVDGLIAKNVWQESDRDMLMGLEEKVLEKMTPVEQPKKNETSKVDPNPMTEADVLQACPTIRNRLEQLERMEGEQKDIMIAVITKNPKNTFKPDYLKTLDLVMLQNMANLAKVEESKQPEGDERFFNRNYGMGGGVTDSGDKNVPILKAPTVKNIGKK